MTERPRYRLAMYWAAACGGCDIAVLNLGQALLDVSERFDIVFWPAVMDAKVRDVEAMPDGSIDLTLFDGGIRSDENAELARLLRRKSRLLVAFGSCATEGCIPGLANLRPVDRMLADVYDAPGTDPGLDGSPVHPIAEWDGPGGVLRLPRLRPILATLGEIVPVDYSVPGCPPETDRIAEVVGTLLAALDGVGPLPPAGAVLGAGRSTVCDECGRRRDLKHLAHFERVTTLAHIDPERCLLDQGLPCNGPATRDGCGARCPSAGAPCIGCYGPTEGVRDGGARLLSAFASIVEASDPEAIDRVLDGLPDPVGQFYRFGLAASLLGGGRAAADGAPGASTASPDLPQPRMTGSTR